MVGCHYFTAMVVQKLTFRVVVWVLIALARLRFPVNESLLSVIRRRYNDNTVRLIRRFERLDRKLRKAELDLAFLDKCNELGLIPNFLLFKVSNKHLRNSNVYISCCKSLLNEERDHKRSHIRIHRRELISLKSELQRVLNVIDYSHVISCLLRSNDKGLDLQKKVQDKKLHKLLERSKAFCNDPKKVIHNFSSHKLSKIEEDLLVKGLNFSILPKNLNYADYCVNFELLFRSLRFDKNLGTDTLEFIRTRIKDVALSSFRDFKSNSIEDNNLTKDEQLALKNLAAKKDLVIQKSDKGNSIVILNKPDYKNKVLDIILDSEKFKKVHILPGKEIRFMLNQEKRFKTILSTLHKEGKISTEEFNKLNPVGSKPGILYGLSKIHKPLVNGLPKVRPILSAIGTAGYNLAKFLVPLLNPIANSPFSIINSFQFYEDILAQDSSLVMGSLDVDALFTSIPLDETINLGVNNIFKNSSLVKGLTKDDFKELLNLATKESLFIFDGDYYYQTDGVAMGSPLGPTLANLFMSHHEQIWLQNCPSEFKPKFYRRYVDDIFILVEKIEHIDLFKEYLNSKHNNINFTSELEREGKLPFLDTLIQRADGKFITSVYRKPTFTGVYTHFESFLPSVYKFGLLSTLLYRYFSICSSYALFHLEVLQFKKIFLMNGYPSSFIDSCIRKFLDKIFIKKDIKSNVPKKEFFIVLPYLGNLSSKIQKRLQNLFKETVPWGKLNIVFKTHSRLSHLFRFKDLIPKDLVSNIIYSYTCPSCDARYIGETERHSKIRWGEHLGLSCFTNQPVKGINTAIKEHIGFCKCNSGFNNFSIIGSESNKQLREIKESLFINHLKPNLNIQVKSAKLYLF